MNVETKPHLRPSVPWGEGCGAQLSSWGLLPHSRAGEADPSPRCPAWSLASLLPALLLGEQVSRDREAGSAWLETWLRRWAARLSGLSCEMAARCFARRVAAVVFLRRGCIQNTSPPRWGARSREGADGAALTVGEKSGEVFVPLSGKCGIWLSLSVFRPS